MSDLLSWRRGPPTKPFKNVFVWVLLRRGDTGEGFYNGNK